MLGNRSRDTGPELRLRKELHRRGRRFRVHFAPVRGLRCRPDIVFSRNRLAVFVDGCFWHRCPEHATSPTRNAAYWDAKFRLNVERDRRHDQALAEAGWTVLRIWEHDATDAAADRVEQHLERLSNANL
jgi:DNA mismatch endonuclease (patch repair protein)